MTISETKSFFIYLRKIQHEELLREMWLHSGACQTQSLGDFIEKSKRQPVEKTKTPEDDCEAVRFASQFVSLKNEGGG